MNLNKLDILKLICKADALSSYESRLTALLDKLWTTATISILPDIFQAIRKNKPFQQLWTKAADQVIISVKSALKAETKKIWLERKRWYSKNKQYLKKDKIGIDFSGAEIEAIDQLITGQLAWIGDYSNKSKIAQTITAEYTELWKQKKSGNQIAKILTEKYGNLTPEKYKKMFGEYDYWNNWTRHHGTLSSSFATINNFEGVRKTFTFHARMIERQTCPTCKSYHNKIFSVPEAVKQKNAYLKAAGEGDIEGMKTARPWITHPDDNKTLPVPPLHWQCHCRMLSNLTESYDLEEKLV